MKKLSIFEAVEWKTEDGDVMYKKKGGGCKIEWRKRKDKIILSIDFTGHPYFIDETYPPDLTDDRINEITDGLINICKEMGGVRNESAYYQFKDDAAKIM